MKHLNTVVKFIGSVAEKRRQNKLELIRGSVLDPLNHPSYTHEQIASTEAKRVAREKALVRLEKKYS